MPTSTGLTGIVQGSGVNCAPFVRLAYLNSTTLQSLAIRLNTEANWRGLLYDRTMGLAKFECLESLAVEVTDTSYNSTWSIVAGAAPFPVLSTLEVIGGYPFDDDLLFGGNGQTMQSLRLPFSALARNALGRFDVLKRNGAGRLNTVSIGAVSSVDEVFVAGLDVVPLEQQIHSILEIAATLSIKDEATGICFFNLIESAPSTSVLQRLELENLWLSVTCVHSIASAIPSLASLTCHLEEVNLPAVKNPYSKSTSNLRTGSCVLITNLREIRVPYTTTATAVDLAK
ncbi:hypothetical protein IWW38_006126, partial [Coemansia aciculifera]